MDILGRFLGGDVRAHGPIDDFWYQPVGVMTAAGVRVDSEGAQKMAAWFRGRLLLATAVAMLPWHVFQRLQGDGGSESAKSHPLYDLLHRKPNSYQDAFVWRRQKMFHLIDHGNGYDVMVRGSNGYVKELRPIHPTLVTPELISTGRKVFHVRDATTGRTTTYSSDDIFHLCGASEDGVHGMGILSYARGSLGTALATEQYAAKIFSNGTLSGGVIKTMGPMDDESGRTMARSFVTAAGAWHMPRILPMGADFIESKLTPEDAQMLLSRQFSVDDVSRWLGVPRSMLQNSDPSYGNAEQFRQDFVDFSLGEWLSLFEFGANDQLIAFPEKYFTEFMRDALVRGDIAQRWAAYQIAVSTGTFTRNEVRRKENMRKLDGLDTPLDPAFLAGKQAEPKTKALQPAEDDDDADAAAALRLKAQAITRSAAERLLRKEVNAVQKAAVRHANNGDEFAATVSEFYTQHVELVVQTLRMPEQQAKEYCASQCAQAIGDDWLNALELWQTSAYAAGLAAVALEEAA